MSMIENTMQKPVTMKDIAVHLGISFWSAHEAYYGRSTAERNAEVRAAAEQLGYDPKAARRLGSHPRTNRVKLSDVAKAAGVSLNTVSNVLGGYRCLHTADTIRKVEEAVSQLGYKTIKERAAERPQKFYHNGNFHTKQEEVARMHQLRSEGFSNAEIAAKIGRHYTTVYANIGKQPDDMSKQNRAEAHHAIARRNAQRRTYVMTHEINQHNELVEKVERINADIREVETKLTSLRKEQSQMTAQLAKAVPHIRKLSEQTGVKMRELPPVQVNMSDLTPTQLQ